MDRNDESSGREHAALEKAAPIQSWCPGHADLLSGKGVCFTEDSFKLRHDAWHAECDDQTPRGMNDTVMSDTIHSDPQIFRTRHLLPAWLAVVGATVLYCELSQLAQNRPFVAPNVSLLWNVKVWTVWIELSLALATDRGRSAAATWFERPVARLALLLLLPSLALGYEWAAGAIFAAAGWLAQEDSIWVLIYRRLPLYAAALLAVVVAVARRRAPSQPKPSQATYAHTITVMSARGPVEVPISEVEAIVAAENYVELCLIDGKRYLHRATLMNMSELLSSYGIVRVHRSVSVNAQHVLKRLPQHRLLLRSGRIVRVGRAFRGALPT